MAAVARCGSCSGGGTHNSLRAALVIGDDNELTRRVFVTAASDAHPMLRPGRALYVTGEGVQPLLDQGVLTLA